MFSEIREEQLLAGVINVDGEGRRQWPAECFQSPKVGDGPTGLELSSGCTEGAWISASAAFTPTNAP